MWCNTAALQRAGITADTPDPVLGKIPHRADGSVLGTLREWGATDLVMNVMPPLDEQVRIDALEHVVAQNGPRDRRPVIAHCQLVDDADLSHFARLGVIPNMQPLWAQLDSPMTVLTIPRPGAERADKQYPIRTLDTSSAPLGFGSDWPVSSGAPLDGLAVAASRRTPEGDPVGGWTPHEILPIERAWSAYTAGVANQAFAEGDWGHLAAGADAGADMVWLDRDPRATPPLELPSVAVRATYLRGDPVYAPPA